MRMLGCLLTVGLLAGCASSGADYRNEAVAHALETEAELRAWVQACEPVSGEAMDAARSADRSWWQRNGQLLRAADYGFIQELDNFTDERRDDSVALFTMRAGYALSAQMQSYVADQLDVRNPERVCLRQMADFESGERDLNQNADYYRALVALSNEGDIDETPLRASRQPERPSDRYGRSYYEAQSALARDSCPDAELQLINSAWPREVYEAQCQNQRYALVSCEWGNCQVR